LTSRCLPTNIKTIPREYDKTSVLFSTYGAQTLPLQTRLEQLESTAYSLEELAYEVRSYGDNLDYDPHRLEEVQNRLELIKNLKRKYGASSSEIIDYLANAENELEGLTYSGESREQLKEKIEQLIFEAIF